MIWQRMMATLHSKNQQRTGKDGDTDDGRQKPELQQKTYEVMLNCASMNSIQINQLADFWI